GDDGIARIAGPRPHDPPYRAGVHPAFGRLHVAAIGADRLEHPPGQADRLVDGPLDVAVLVDLDADDGAVPGQVPLAGHAFLADQRVSLGLFERLLGEVLRPRAMFPVLAEGDSDFAGA